jgi:hypothetical protein
MHKQGKLARLIFNKVKSLVHQIQAKQNWFQSAEVFELKSQFYDKKKKLGALNFKNGIIRQL